MLRVLALLLMLALASPAAADEPTVTPECFDLAVVAQVLKQTPREIPDEPDVIVMRWPWDIDIKVLRVLAGEAPAKRMRIVASLHNDFNPTIRHFLFFLRREPSGEYVLTDMEWRIVRDRSGRMVWLVDEPLTEYELEPYTWVAEDYRTLLRPVSYRPSAAWWLHRDHIYLPRVTSDEWVFEAGDGMVARQGIYLDDLLRYIERRNGRCLS